jgi:hypothetical protein
MGKPSSDYGGIRDSRKALLLAARHSRQRYSNHRLPPLPTRIRQVSHALDPIDIDATLDRLSDLAQDVLARCRARGATQAEVGLNEDRGLSVDVRMGEVETIEHNRDRGLSLTVYFGQRKASASTADLDPDSIETTIDQACAIARHTEADEHAGLADAARMAPGRRDRRCSSRACAGASGRRNRSRS